MVNVVMSGGISPCLLETMGRSDLVTNGWKEER